jgi:hypothetical protein
MNAPSRRFTSPAASMWGDCPRIAHEMRAVEAGAVHEAEHGVGQPLDAPVARRWAPRR